MAKQSRISKKELEQDQTLETFEQIFFWVSHNRNTVIGILLAVAVAFLAAGYYNHQQEQKYTSASNELFQALQQYEQAIQQNTWGSEGRREAMAEVRTLCDQLINEYPGTKTAQNALFLKGNTYYFEGDAIGDTSNTQEAIRVFEEVQAQANDPFERASALVALGYAHENMFVLSVGSEQARNAAFNAALDYYNQIIDMEEVGFLRYEAMISKARLLADQGQTEEAEELLRTVLEERGEFPEEPGPTAPDSERIVYRIRDVSNQFSLANTARIQLRRMGVDVEQVMEEIRQNEESEEE